MACKFCPDCGADRPVAEFNRDKRRRDGLAFYCREHARARDRRSRERRLGAPKRRVAVGFGVPPEHKWCPDCDSIKPLTDFPRSRATVTGRYTYCKPCHNARGKATLASVGGARTHHLKRRYGISAAEADAISEAQGGVCAICRTVPAQHVDHDHATGAVRALLCFDCNGGLGQFKDDPDVLRAPADYVGFHTLSQRITAMFAAAGLAPVRAIRVERPPVGSP